MAMTLLQLKEAWGSRIDDAMDRCTRFHIPRSEFCDLKEIHMFQDLPRSLFYWSLSPMREAVQDVVTVKDYEAGTATATQRIPHKIVVKVLVISDDVDEIDDDNSQQQADSMRDALLAELGDFPCIEHEDESVAFLYEGFVDGASESESGIYTYTFTFEGLIFLDGRSNTGPMILNDGSINYEFTVFSRLEPAEEDVELPTPNPDIVGFTELTGDVGHP